MVFTLLIAGSLLMQAAAAPQKAPAGEASKRATERIRALQQEADELAARERTLLGELRNGSIDEFGDVLGAIALYGGILVVFLGTRALPKTD